MATPAELEAAQLSVLRQTPSLAAASAARALLESPPFKSDSALGFLTTALAVLAANATEDEPAWLKKLAKKSQRDWFLQSLTSTGALIARIHEGPARPKAIALPAKPHARWLALSAAQSSDALPKLLADLLDGPATQIAERAQALLGWPKDSRIAAIALDAHRGRLVKNLRHPIWSALGNLIAVHSDAALRKKLWPLLTEEPALAGPYWVSHFRGGADPAADSARLTTGKDTSAPQTAADWEAWVLAEPTDNQRRAAWADWLLEQSDPRGELLSLQLLDRPLASVEQRRVNALVKKHGRRWMGKLGAIIEPAGLCFARGFAVTAGVTVTSDARIPLDDPHWATLESLVIPQQIPPAKLAQKVVDLLPQLRSLGGLHPAIAQTVFDAGAPLLAHLGFALELGDRRLPANAFVKGRLPALRSVQLDAGPAQVEQLMGKAWFNALTRLTVLTRKARLAQWLTLLNKTKLDQVHLLDSPDGFGKPTGEGFSYLLTREGRQWALQLVPPAAKSPGRHVYDAVNAALDEVPPTTFSSIAAPPELKRRSSAEAAILG